jgi:hypothetical protein
MKGVIKMGKAKEPLYGGMHETTFRRIAKKAVVDYWNGNKTLVKNYGEINTQKVYISWQVKAIQNSKAMLGVSTGMNDGYYFEYSYDGASAKGYLDVYKKQTQRVIEFA